MPQDIALESWFNGSAKVLRHRCQEARAEIYRKIQDMIVQDAPWVNLFTSRGTEGVADRVKGWTHYLSQSMRGARDAWIDKG